MFRSIFSYHSGLFGGVSNIKFINIPTERRKSTFATFPIGRCVTLNCHDALCLLLFWQYCDQWLNGLFHNSFSFNVVFATRSFATIRHACDNEITKTILFDGLSINELFVGAIYSGKFIRFTIYTECIILLIIW